MIDEAKDDVSWSEWIVRTAVPQRCVFTDGSTYECDIVVGADGIYSTVRKILLGEEDPAAHLRNAGWWAVMALKPYEEARACLGSEYARDADAEASDSWQRVVSVEDILKLYQDWPPYLKDAVVKLLCGQPEQPAIYFWEHPPARTYAFGHICIVGDAAHATTPWHGSRGGMSIEDTLVLSALLGHAGTRTEALKALEIYDRVRRPRTQRIVESSSVTGTILTGKGEETELDLDKLRKKLLPRWDFILDFDNEKHRDKAIEMMTLELKT
ncbi:hypothetical protein JX265_007675 [Neoarthrinium moseri]|uniref:FAD-binding domain-containing protein n=1 Tax=Neoarthrinium moseri TaxID=1658444 RepID=A0A9P9WJX6_9PEZI|nr:hypothetical protein JX265_007675 [Neoarthrinium moseri]